MTPSPKGLIGFGVGVGLAGAATAAGLVADRMHRRRAEALETGESLVAVPSRELVVVAGDGVPLHVEVDEPVEDSERTVTSGDATVPKATVVLTHGYCLSSACWVFQRRALTRAGHRVVVWDQRGHGRSEKGDAASYTIDQLGDDLHRVLEQVVPEGPLLLVGHSMGGMTMLALAEQHPGVVKERVGAAAFVATSAGGQPLAAGDVAASIGRVLIERLGPATAGVFADRPELLKTVLRANKDLAEHLVERYSFASPVPRSVVRLAASMLLGTDLRVVSGFSPAFATYDKIRALEAYRGADVLVFNGEDDVLTPPAHSEAIVQVVPGAEHLVLRDAGHVIMLEHPDVLSDHLVDLGERTARAAAEGLAAQDKPRTRQVLTNVAKQQIIERARERRRAQRRDRIPVPRRGRAVRRPTEEADGA
ncbi:alpha/beta fold hydrolase [Lapillicoccus jejuensis]|uniref:Pimeloyl-ACP methyl ester carboxylesterase n=1 Tax=Lapillicoccus jejuensis TaxID=402171 RepID=A0A542E257_9MICO|nr:alpha/beta hydrolase [Lapillicoccus jejuensis]TQJ09314.1 pimeloyl-ACP methyl ester carboxylesterase [Lapillicoccus jejuensis]